MRRPTIAILGLPYFGGLLRDILAAQGWDASYLPHPGRSLAGWARVAREALVGADIVYIISSRAEQGSPQDHFLRFRRGPVVIHWVGTDVLIAADEARAGYLSRRVVERPVHWADATWLADELVAIGFRAEFVPLPIPGLATGTPPPLPDRFRVLLYLPVDPYDREVFDVETLLALPAAVPEAEFVVIPSPAASLPAPLPPNLEARAWVDDMDALYREITVYVRQTKHDGMSFMALECLSRGRHVVWSFPVAGAIHAAGLDAVASELRRLHALHEAGRLGPNEAGLEYVRRQYDTATLAADLDRRLRELL